MVAKTFAAIYLYILQFNTNGEFMTKNHIISIVFLIIGFIGGKYAYDMFFTESEIVSFEDSDWGRKNILGVRFDAPFELSETEIDLPPSVGKYVKVMNTFQYTAQSLSLFVSRAEYNEGISLNLDGAVNGSVQNMKANKDITDFNYEIKPIEKHSLTGRLLQGTCKMKGKDAEFIGEIYLKDTKLIQILSFNLSHEENREARDRIMKSVSIAL
jgi:hypothetical protein